MSTTQLSQDDVLDLLSSARRRYVLYLLRNEDDPVALTTLAEQVAAWENDTTVESITDQERKRVYVSLYQTHIPRLAEVGLVEYNQETGSVSIEPPAKEIDPYLNSPSMAIPWDSIYLVLAVLGAVSVGISLVGGFEMESAIAGAVIGIFLLTAVSHTVYNVYESKSTPNELRKHL